jgi:hypothetical protein
VAQKGQLPMALVSCEVLNWVTLSARKKQNCLYACEHFLYFLFDRKFVIRTDLKSLTTL